MDAHRPTLSRQFLNWDSFQVILGSVELMTLTEQMNNNVGFTFLMCVPGVFKHMDSYGH